MLNAGLLLVALTIVGFKWPRVLAVPLAIFAAWVAISLFSQAFTLWRRKRRPARAASEPEEVLDRDA
jgi:hypothetical protein